MKTRVNVGTVLVVAFVFTLITGIMLHLKRHGIVFQPRDTIKIVHWAFGYAMTVAFFIHWKQFCKMLTAIKKTFRWFYADTWLLIILFLVTLLTGTVKLLSPVKIANLGLWHYWTGIAMSITAAIHLIRGIPTWNRLRKAAS